MARFTIVREERTAPGDTWRICSSQTMDTSATRYSVSVTMEAAHAKWLGDDANRRIVVHEWDK